VAYAWNRHGRCYADYQRLSKDKRLALTIGGEPVAEVDLCASHPTAIHGLFGHELPEGDLYEAVVDPRTGEFLPRKLVKSVATVLIANRGNVPKDWLPDKMAKFAKDYPNLSRDYPAALIGQALLDTYPVLMDWKASGLDSNALMFQESRAVLAAVCQAKDRGFAALPVHDSLIVALSHAEEAAGVLKAAFGAEFNIRPRVDIRRSTDAPPRMPVECGR
jgi:hypothetical protein